LSEYNVILDWEHVRNSIVSLNYTKHGIQQDIDNLQMERIE